MRDFHKWKKNWSIILLFIIIFLSEQEYFICMTWLPCFLYNIWNICFCYHNSHKYLWYINALFYRIIITRQTRNCINRIDCLTMSRSVRGWSFFLTMLGKCWIISSLECLQLVLDFHKLKTQSIMILFIIIFSFERELFIYFMQL